LELLRDREFQLFLDYQIMGILNATPRINSIFQPLFEEELTFILNKLLNQNLARVINNQAWHYNPFHYYYCLGKGVKDEDNPDWLEMMREAGARSVLLSKKKKRKRTNDTES